MKQALSYIFNSLEVLLVFQLMSLILTLKITQTSKHFLSSPLLQLELFLQCLVFKQLQIQLPKAFKRYLPWTYCHFQLSQWFFILYWVSFL